MVLSMIPTSTLMQTQAYVGVLRCYIASPHLLKGNLNLQILLMNHIASRLSVT